MIHQCHFCVGVQKVKRRRKKIKVSPKFLPPDSSLNQSVTFSSFSSQKQSCLKGLGYITDVNFLCSFSSVQTDWQRVIERSCSLPPFLTRPPPHCCLSLVLLPLGEEVGLAPVPSPAWQRCSESHLWMVVPYLHYRLFGALFSSPEGPVTPVVTGYL